MAHPNVETIEAAYAAFAVGDMAAILQLWTDDVAWHSTGDNPVAGDYEGKGAVAQFLGSLVAQTGGTLRVELKHVLADDNAGYSLHTETATKDGEELEAWTILGYEFADGKIKEIWTYSYDQKVNDKIFA